MISPNATFRELEMAIAIDGLVTLREKPRMESFVTCGLN
jgi:hypothetical protein